VREEDHEHREDKVVVEPLLQQLRLDRSHFQHQVPQDEDHKHILYRTVLLSPELQVCYPLPHHNRVEIAPHEEH
jgi:hypothetical protein